MFSCQLNTQTHEVEVLGTLHSQTLCVFWQSITTNFLWFVFPKLSFSQHKTQKPHTLCACFVFSLCLLFVVIDCQNTHMQHSLMQCAKDFDLVCLAVQPTWNHWWQRVGMPTPLLVLVCLLFPSSFSVFSPFFPILFPQLPFSIPTFLLSSKFLYFHFLFPTLYNFSLLKIFIILPLL